MKVGIAVVNHPTSANFTSRVSVKPCKHAVVVPCASLGGRQARREAKPKRGRLAERSATGIFGRALKEFFVEKRDVSETEEVNFSEWFRSLAFVAASAELMSFLHELAGGIGTRSLMSSAVVGGLIGIHFAVLNSVARKNLWHEPHKALNVVITGGTQGIGKAIAREFLKTGDRVYIVSRSQKSVEEALQSFENDLEKWGRDQEVVMGSNCDISIPENVVKLSSSIEDEMGHVDIWVNCAGCSGSFQEFADTSVKTISQIVRTNLLGSLLCTQHAISLMRKQPHGGHIFNTEGAGSDLSSTPNYATYGATKAGISQFTKSLHSEIKDIHPVVGIHMIQPGMVLTKLLLEGTTVKHKQIFNVLCEQPETVAAFLVPRMRTVVAKNCRSTKIAYLTLGRALERLCTAPFRFGRFFDDQGRTLYPSEGDRLHGSHSHVTNRLAEDARDRSKHLAALYSFCMACTFYLIASSEINV